MKLFKICTFFLVIFSLVTVKLVSMDNIPSPNALSNRANGETVNGTVLLGALEKSSSKDFFSEVGVAKSIASDKVGLKAFEERIDEEFNPDDWTEEEESSSDDWDKEENNKQFSHFVMILIGRLAEDANKDNELSKSKLTILSQKLLEGDSLDRLTGDVPNNIFKLLRCCENVLGLSGVSLLYEKLEKRVGLSLKKIDSTPMKDTTSNEGGKGGGLLSEIFSFDRRKLKKPVETKSKDEVSSKDLSIGSFDFWEAARNNMNQEILEDSDQDGQEEEIVQEQKEEKSNNDLSYQSNGNAHSEEQTDKENLKESIEPDDQSNMAEVSQIHRQSTTLPGGLPDSADLKESNFQEVSTEVMEELPKQNPQTIADRVKAFEGNVILQRTNVGRKLPQLPPAGEVKKKIKLIISLEGGIEKKKVVKTEFRNNEKVQNSESDSINYSNQKVEKIERQAVLDKSVPEKSRKFTFKKLLAATVVAGSVAWLAKMYYVKYYKDHKQILQRKFNDIFFEPA